MAIKFAYLTYLNYAESWIAVIAHFTATISISHFLFCVHFSKKFSKYPFILKDHPSKPMISYMYIHAIMSTVCTPYKVYIVYKWQPLAPTSTTALYDPFWLFWTGLWTVDYMTMAPLCVLMLTVDRCLRLGWPLWYGRWQIQNFVVWTGMSAILVTFLGSTWMFLQELPLDLKKTARCESFTCVCVKSLAAPQTLMKLIFGTVNLSGCILFFYKLRKSSVRGKLKDRVIKYTAIFEILFDMCPAYFNYFFNTITGEASTNYIGVLSGTLTQVDAAICGLLYTFLYLRRRKGPNDKITRQKNATDVGSYSGRTSILVVTHTNPSFRRSLPA
ncbi:hypothetical protein Ddc_10989 [Ditylenchus destructor]|nr:hypothetical protein Ddc_10989 [Ditylenchus destructor]